MLAEAFTHVTPPAAALNPAEREQLAQAEHAIREYQRSSVAFLAALLAIHDGQLYRERFRTFEIYLAEAWGIQESYGHKLVRAARAQAALAAGGELPPATAVSQLVELAAAGEEAAEVWRESSERVGGGTPPAAVVRQVVTELRGAERTPAAPAVVELPSAQVDEAQPEDLDEDDEPSAGDGDEHGTPDWLIDAIHAFLGGPPELDPASSAVANARIGASRFFDKGQDGLAQDWEAETFFCNPPFSRGLIERFVGKFLEAVGAKKLGESLFLVNAKTASSWYKRLWAGGVACMLDRRPAYVDLVRLEAGLPQKGGSGWSSATLWYFGPRPQAFADHFAKYGEIVTSTRWEGVIALR